MIQANELRIGNWLKNFLGEYFEANATTISSFESGIHPFGAPQSIALTPELLEQCGFVKDHGGFSLPDKMSLSISVTKDNEFLPCWMDHTLYPGAWRTVQYLHQLQNLYFALTGQELEINFKVK